MNESPSIKSGRIKIERKQFFFDLKENERGKFLRITEDVNGRRDAIIVPIGALPEFRALLDEMIVHSNGHNGNGNGASGNGNGDHR